MAALTTTRYPVVVHGQLDTELSRWRWLVKWFLTLPHLIMLDRVGLRLLRHHPSVSKWRNREIQVTGKTTA